MMWPVSEPNESNGRLEGPAEGSSVLANLPRTRPQRATARRTAARRSGEAESAQRTKTASPPRATKPAKAAKAKPAKPPKARVKPPASPKSGTAARPQETVPRQGFECEGDRASGPVSPPGGLELVASAAEMFGELAKSGIIGGERLLRDVLARLPGS